MKKSKGMHHVIWVLVFFAILIGESYGQAGMNLLWEKTIDSGYGDDIAYDVTIDSNENVIAAGFLSAQELETRSAYAVQFNDAGTNVWELTEEQGPYDPSLPNTQGIGKHSSDDRFLSVTVDNADNIILGGMISGVWNGYVDGSYHTAMMLRRYSTSHELQWEEIYWDAPGSAWNYYRSVTTGLDNAIFGCGLGFGTWSGAEYQWITLKYDTMGNQVLGPLHHDNISDIYLPDSANDIALDSDGNIIVVGQIGVGGADTSKNFDWHIRKYSPDGTLLWSKTHAFTVLSDVATSVTTYPDGDIVVGGYFNRGTDNGDGADYEVQVNRYDASGTQIDNMSVHNGNVDTVANDFCRDIVALPDGGYFFVGEYEDAEGVLRGWLMRFSEDNKYVYRNSFDSLRSLNRLDIQDNHIALAGAKDNGTDLDFYTAFFTFTDPADPCDEYCDSIELTDTDGDGLDDCFECQSDMNLEDPDTDGDGMDDHFEFRYNLNPLVDDASEDADNDGISNLEEYLQRTDPMDVNSPTSVVCVATDGNDTTGDGSLASPWRTIGHALDNVAPTETAPVAVLVKPGNFEENFSLKSWVTLLGDPEGPPIISGTIIGASNARIENVEVVAPAHGDYTLVTVMGPMELIDVSLRGTITREATGVLVQSSAGSETLISNCLFHSLRVGLSVNGAIPIVRRSSFINPSRTGILLEGSPGKAPVKSIGDQTDPRTGWNSFNIGAGAFAVENNTGTALVMEYNDWGTEVESEIDALISGEADFEPYLGVGSAILASSLFCSVSDGQTQSTIPDALVTLTPSSYRPVSGDENGIHAFPVLAPDSYTMKVTAAGYTTVTRLVRLESAELKSVIVALWPGAAEGEGEGEGEKPSPGCSAGTERSENLPSTLWVMFVTLAVLLGYSSRHNLRQK